MTSQPYQLLPPLTAEEYAALRADIEANGVLVPVVRDQHGNLLDGHHRVQIASELGVKYRIDVVQVADEQQARSLARTYNMARRHLTREQKRKLIADEITDNPDRSDREIARLMGCDHKTVGSVRRELRGEVPQRQDPWPERVEEMKAGLAGLEAAIGANLQNLDVEILVRLLRSESPFEVVGWLAAAWHQFELEHHDLGEDFMGPVRRVLYTDRVTEVLAWPQGWYAEECMRSTDELRDMYTAATGRAV